MLGKGGRQEEGAKVGVGVGGAVGGVEDWEKDRTKSCQLALSLPTVHIRA